MPAVLFPFYLLDMWKRQRKLSEWLAAGACCAVRCNHCGHTGKLTSRMLVARFGGGATAKDVGRKMRCTACGKRGAKLAPIPS